MSYSPRSPQLVRGGLVLLDRSSRRAVRVAVFQYNPEKLRRTLVPSGEDAAAAAELVQLELELDATARLSAGDQQLADGIAPQLAALESIAFPTGILAAEPTTVLVWGSTRVWPVRVTELVVVEEAFDQELRPIRASVAMTMEIARGSEAERERLAEQGSRALAELGVDEGRLFPGDYSSRGIAGAGY